MRPLSVGRDREGGSTSPRGICPRTVYDRQMLWQQQRDLEVEDLRRLQLEELTGGSSRASQTCAALTSPRRQAPESGLRELHRTRSAPTTPRRTTQTSPAAMSRCMTAEADAAEADSTEADTAAASPASLAASPSTSLVERLRTARQQRPPVGRSAASSPAGSLSAPSTPGAARCSIGSVAVSAPPPAAATSALALDARPTPNTSGAILLERLRSTRQLAGTTRPASGTPSRCRATRLQNVGDHRHAVAGTA